MRQQIAISYPLAAAAADFAAAARVARDIRLARIQRLQARVTRKFRDAYFAHQLATSARDAAAPRSA